MSLRSQTITGIRWSLFGNVLNQVTTFIIGVILARILTPEEFGLIGMTTVFIVLADTFIDSGFSQALIRKNDCTQADLSTAFYFNIIASVVIYTLLFISSGFIADFFNEESLIIIIRVASIGMIINSLAIVQQTILIKEINFKMQTKISVISAILSGIIALVLAFNNFGVWSLVFKSLLASLISTILYWSFNKWRPDISFSIKSFWELFSFGSKLLTSNLIDRFYWNIYYVVIGKNFSTETLGYYTRAEMFKNLLSQNIVGVINNVSYPVLSMVQSEKYKLRSNFKLILFSSMFLISFLLMLLIVLAEPIVIMLIGEKWHQSIVFIQLLSVSAILFPASLLNITILKIVNRTDTILKIEPVKKIFAIPAILLGVFYSIEAMIVFLIFNSLVDFILNGYFAGKHIEYRVFNQLYDLSYVLITPFLSCMVVFFCGLYFDDNSFQNLFLLILIGFSVLIFINEILKNEYYLIIRQIILKNLLKYNR